MTLTMNDPVLSIQSLQVCEVLVKLGKHTIKATTSYSSIARSGIVLK